MDKRRINMDKLKIEYFKTDELIRIMGNAVNCFLRLLIGA